MKRKEDYFEDLVQDFLKKLESAIEIDALVGSKTVLSMSNTGTRNNRRSALNLTKTDKQAIINTILDHIKGVNLDMSKRINSAINENITQGGSVRTLATKIKSIMSSKSVNHFNYKKRFETIARTESTRVMSISASNTAQKLGAKKKWLLVKEDERTSCICGNLHNSFGSEEQAILIDKNFEAICDGKAVSQLLPPFHPNCRTIVMYTFE